MYNFFDFYTNISKEFVFQRFDAEHLMSIFLIFSIIFLSFIFFKKLSPKKQKIILKTTAICVPLLELSHNIWLYFYGNANLTQLLSLHLCGMQMYFIPLAVFTKFLVFKDFAFATAILGGIFGIIFPSGISNAYPLWHYQTLQTFLYHALLIFVPMAILITTDYRPTLKRFHKVLILFFVIVFLAFIVNLTFDQNYLFLITAPDMLLLKNIQNNYGTVTYLFFTFCALLLICICIHLPFYLHKTK